MKRFDEIAAELSSNRGIRSCPRRSDQCESCDIRCVVGVVIAVIT